MMFLFCLHCIYSSKKVGPHKKGKLHLGKNSFIHAFGQKFHRRDMLWVQFKWSKIYRRADFVQQNTMSKNSCENALENAEFFSRLLLRSTLQICCKSEITFFIKLTNIGETKLANIVQKPHPQGDVTFFTNEYSPLCNGVLEVHDPWPTPRRWLA